MANANLRSDAQQVQEEVADRTDIEPYSMDEGEERFYVVAKHVDSPDEDRTPLVSIGVESSEYVLFTGQKYERGYDVSEFYSRYNNMDDAVEKAQEILRDRV